MRAPRALCRAVLSPTLATHRRQCSWKALLKSWAPASKRASGEGVHRILVSSKRVAAMSSALFGLARQTLRAAGQRCMSSGADEGFKVTVLGAAGGIGQPLSLLMKVRSGPPARSLRVRCSTAPPISLICLSMIISAYACMFTDHALSQAARPREQRGRWASCSEVMQAQACAP